MIRSRLCRAVQGMTKAAAGIDKIKVTRARGADSSNQSPHPSITGAESDPTKRDNSLALN